MSRESKKVALIGGGGIRTPLLVYGLVKAQAALGIEQLALYDVDRDRVELMAALGREVIRQSGGELKLTTTDRLEDAVEGAHFILSSTRVGGMQARARDERIAIEHGLVGQETTGPAGMAMALRTIPVVLKHARIIERSSPNAWVINFTNPVGIITQALTTHTNVHVIGICDTPSELFHRIAEALGERPEDVRCDYFGLNHLGWVRDVSVRGQSVMKRLLDDDQALWRLYPTDLFEPGLIRSLKLIPSEYLFFFYAHGRALANQLSVAASRGEEIERLNAQLFHQLSEHAEAGRMDRAVESYRDYLRLRSASYLRLEGQGASALGERDDSTEDPFESETGYHRIAIEVMTALVSTRPARIVVNVINRGTISDLETLDVVEVPCQIDWQGPVRSALGRVPESVRGLITTVKTYERLVIRAAVEKSLELARLALLVHPLVGEWDMAGRLVETLVQSDPEHLGYLWQENVKRKS
jgi:6-phospho-beta-glucosidase